MGFALYGYLPWIKIPHHWPTRKSALGLPHPPQPPYKNTIPFYKNKGAEEKKIKSSHRSSPALYHKFAMWDWKIQFLLKPHEEKENALTRWFPQLSSSNRILQSLDYLAFITKWMPSRMQATLQNSLTGSRKQTTLNRSRNLRHEKCIFQILTECLI